MNLNIPLATNCGRLIGIGIGKGCRPIDRDARFDRQRNLEILGRRWGDAPNSLGGERAQEGRRRENVVSSQGHGETPRVLGRSQGGLAPWGWTIRQRGSMAAYLVSLRERRRRMREGIPKAS